MNKRMIPMTALNKIISSYEYGDPEGDGDLTDDMFQF